MKPTLTAHRISSHHRFGVRVMAWLGMLALTACAQLEVSSLSTDPKRPVYELRGATLQQLQTDAARLCPQGFDVQRQTQADIRQPGGLKAIGWLNEAWSWLEDDRRQAQMVLSCKVA